MLSQQAKDKAVWKMNKMLKDVCLNSYDSDDNLCIESKVFLYQISLSKTYMFVGYIKNCFDPLVLSLNQS